MCIFVQEVTISKKKSNFACFYQITNSVNKDVEVKIPTPKHWQQSMPVDLFLYATTHLGENIDFLEVLRFSFLVPVVDPSTKDFNPLQHANLQEEFSSCRF